MNEESAPSDNPNNDTLLRITGNFGRILKKLREEQELTQHDLKDRAGLSLRIISDLERGLKQPRLSTLFKLAKGFNISIVELMERLVKEMDESK